MSPLRQAALGLLLGVPVMAGIALFALLLAAQLVDDAAGCGSVDPTDPANYSTVTIRNDTSETVVIDACPGAYCHADQLPVQLQPGMAYSDDAACGVTGADMTAWRIRSPSGTTLGWVAVASRRSTTGLVYRVSRASTRPDVATPVG
jgi:hypothetical protein